MQALILGLLMPVIPLFIWKSYHKETQLTAAQAAARYVVYAMLSAAFCLLVMIVMCDENTSFWEKIDRSPVFALKYVLIEAVAVGLIAAAEWMYCTGKIVLQVDWKGYGGLPVVRFCKKILFPVGVFLLAILVVYLNYGLMNDNVVWGDEAFSANTIRNDITGIFQIMKYWDSHPPFYYLWLKAFAELFGYSVPVYHFASFVPFCGGILFAVTLLRKRYGNIPAAFFVMISGLAAPCLEYNMEIRMYALAFMGLAGCYYSASRIVSGSKAAGWISMVAWALLSAYSHYYALVAAGIMMFVTFVAAYLRYRGKVWIKGVVSMAIFLIGYAPWMGQLFASTKSVSGNWWMTETENLSNSLTMVGCGGNMSRIILPVLASLALVLFLAESSLFQSKKTDTALVIRVVTPSLRGWSDETYTFAVGLLTIAGTLVFAYGISMIMHPLIALRYLYPLCAITAIMLTVGLGRLLKMLQEAGEHFHRKWLVGAGKCVLLLILAVMFSMGLNNYKAYKATVINEDARTAETLYYIGEIGEDTQLINNGITHIGWTVLSYYYPGAEVLNGTYHQASAKDIWYFTPGFLSEEQLAEVNALGYAVPANYGEQQISKYQFILYHFVRNDQPPAAEPASGQISRSKLTGHQACRVAELRGI